MTPLATFFDRRTGKLAVPPSLTQTASRSNPSVAWSSSVMVAVAVAVPRTTPTGSVAAPMVAVKVSAPSTRSSALVGTCSVADLLPARIVKLANACAV